MEHSPGAQVPNITDLLLDAVCIVDGGGRFVFVSAACEQIFGYTQQEMIGKPVIGFVAPDDRERTLLAAQAVMDGRPHLHFENRYVRKDGSLVHIMWSARWSEADQARIAVARDVTQLKQAEARQAALYALSEAAQASGDLASLFRSSHRILGSLLPAPIFAVALPSTPERARPLAYYAGDAAHERRVQRLCEEVLRTGAPLSLDSEAGALAIPLAGSHGMVGVLALCSGDGGAGYGEQERELLLFVSNQLAAAIERKQLQAQMQFMAMHDELTGLPNRRLFYDRLDNAFSRAQRQGAGLALLFIDLNRFKQVNDRHGHLYGDRLLQQVARRIASSVRDSDTLARLGGDEFVVLLENILQPADAGPVMDKIHQALAAPFDLGDGLVLPASASVGVAHYPEHGASMQELLARADQAMYVAKQQAGKAPAA